MKLLSFNEGVNTPCVFALGFFDGVHLGHRAVIENAMAEAKRLGLACAVFTFTSSKKTEKGSIYPFERRLELIEEMGVDYVLAPDFSEFQSLSPDEFLNVLAKKFGAKVFCCGENFRYGKNALGNINTLREFAEKNGGTVRIAPAVTLDGQTVSSTAIREMLSNGRIKEANKMLGREFSIKAEVIKGMQIGSKKLYPTINQPLFEGSVPLKHGVYASKTVVEGECFPSITNIGYCPTVKDTCEISFETYILSQNLELYGKSVEVFLRDFIREERKFESAEALKSQIEEDIKRVKNADD